MLAFRIPEKLLIMPSYVGYSQVLATMVITANTIIVPNIIHLTVSVLRKECK